MQLYQFEKIYSQMGNEFGKMRKGEEEAYLEILFPMENNALITYRNNQMSNSHRMREAIALVLFDIKGHIEGKIYDTDKFRDEDNMRLENALLMAFDPFTNEKLHESLKEPLDEMDLHDYYTIPIKCLLKIKESVDKCEKHSGDNGYFDFLEKNIGNLITKDELYFSLITKL